MYHFAHLPTGVNTTSQELAKFFAYIPFDDSA